VDSVVRCVDYGGGCGMRVTEPCPSTCSRGTCVECVSANDCPSPTRQTCRNGAYTERAVWAEGTITLADGTTLPFETDGFSDAYLLPAGPQLRFQMGYSIWALYLTGAETVGAQPLHDGRPTGLSTVLVSWSHLGTMTSASNDGGYGQSTGTLTLTEASFTPGGRIAGHVRAALVHGTGPGTGMLDSDFVGTFPP
jgi:hypothetical protein